MNFNQLMKFILSAMPFALMCFACYATNLKKEIRGRQFPSVIVGIVYTIIAIIRYNAFSNRLLDLIKAIAAFMIRTGKEHPRYQSVLTTIANKILNIDWTVFLIFVANFLLLAIFLVIKRIALPIYKKVWSKENIFNSTSTIAYEWNEAYSCYCLKDNLFAVKKLQRVYFAVTCIAMYALLVLVKQYPKWPGFQGVMYPFAAVIIVGEIFFFLDGKTAGEYEDAFSGDAGSSRRHALYFPFAHYLITAFGERLIDAKTTFSNYIASHNNHDIVKKYENVDTQEGKLTNLYFHKKTTARDYIDTENPNDPLNKRLLDPGDDIAVKLDEALVDATFRLMNGESVLFATPFYKDYTDYIYLPINRSLMRGNKVLFILGRNGIEDEVTEWITSSLERAVSVPEMWKVARLSGETDFDGDVGIVNAADVLGGDIINRNKEFIGRVKEVVMLEPSQFISTAQLSISVYVKSVHPGATYYIFDKNNDGLIDSISHIIRKSILSVTPTNREKNINTYMLWKADGDHLSHKLFPSVARYLGVGTELMIAALKEQIREAEWYGYNKFPLAEMKWISQQYYPVLCEYASLPQRQEELESRMKFNHNMWGAEKQEYKYLVVEDEFCNLYEIARQFSYRGTKETFVNVISQNYLLRDYMEYNPTLFVNDPKAIPSFVPDYSRTNRNLVLELLLKLYSAPVDESEIVTAFRYIGLNEFFNDYKSYQVKDKLYELIVEILPVAGSCSKEGLIDERDGTYRIKQRDDDSIKAALDELKCIYYITEDEKEMNHYLDAKLYGQVYQSHLPGQHVVIGGKYYEILLIGADKGVVLKRAGDHIHNREYYRQLRKYDIASFEFDEAIGSHSTFGGIIIDRGYADIEVTTDGYLLLDDFGDLKHNCFRKEMNGIPKRVYKKKTVLKLSLAGIDADTRATITLLLNEIFKTVYPDNADFICAVTKTDSEIPDGLLYKMTSYEDADESIYIIEDSSFDMGIISSVQRNIRRFFEIITDYLAWHEEAILPRTKITDEHKVMLDEEAVENAINNTENDNKPEEKKSFFKRLKERRKKKKGNGKPEDNAPIETEEEHETSDAEADAKDSDDSKEATEENEKKKSFFKRRKKKKSKKDGDIPEEKEDEPEEISYEPEDIDQSGETDISSGEVGAEAPEQSSEDSTENELGGDSNE